MSTVEFLRFVPEWCCSVTVRDAAKFGLHSGDAVPYFGRRLKTQLELRSASVMGFWKKAEFSKAIVEQ